MSAAAPFRIGFLLFPDITQLDMTGPAQVLCRMPGAELHYVWKERAPVLGTGGLALMPTDTLETCPPLDMLCVPGGYGCTAMMRDPSVLAWLRRQAEGAQLVTSVCTGSLILGAAGLLRGYRAACHWAWLDKLPLFGADPVAERVVIDRNRITGGGVTAGIDFAFRVIEHLHGRETAEAVQLGLEYDPAPLGGGTPATARPEVLAMVRERMAAAVDERHAEIVAAAEAMAPA